LILPYFLVNPNYLEGGLSNKWLLVQELKQSAIHEISHFAGSLDHDEEFVLRMHALEKNTWRNEKAYKEIAKLRKIEF